MRGKAAVCRVADYSPAPGGLGREPGRPGPGGGQWLCRRLGRAGPWAGGLPAAQRQAGRTLSLQPTPGPPSAAQGGSTLAPAHSRGAGRSGCGSSLVEGQGDSWVGGSPLVGEGAQEGAVGVGGWLGGLPQRGGWEGSSASRPLSSAASGNPGRGLFSLSFPGFLQEQAESPSEGQVPARCPRTSPQPPPHCLHTRAHLLTPLTHTCLNLPAYTLTHTHRSQTPSVWRETDHAGLWPHGPGERAPRPFPGLQAAGAKPAVQMRAQAWGCRTRRWSFQHWSCLHCGLQIGRMGWSWCCPSGGSEQCGCLTSMRTVSWGRTRCETPASWEDAKTPDVVGPSETLTETIDTILGIMELFLNQKA